MNPIIVVRHGQPDDGHIPIAAHWVDAVLSDLGLRQAAAVGRRLADELAGRRCRVWSSDLRRAAQTAEAIGSALDVPVHTTPELREYHGGLAPEVTEAELRRYVPADSRPTEDLLAHRDAESWPAFYGRVGRCMDRLAGADDDRLLVVVAHYGANNCIVHGWLGLPLTAEGDTPLSFETHLASLTVLGVKPDGKRSLIRLNDTAHLRAEGVETTTLLATPRPTVAGEERAEGQADSP